MRKRGPNIHLSNRLSYTLITIVILIAAGIGVYAASSLLTPGTAPNPGHITSQTAPPSGCQAGQILQWSGTANADGGWTCLTLPTPASPCPIGMHANYTYVNGAEDSKTPGGNCGGGWGGCPADTCDGNGGDGWTSYNCPASANLSCTDVAAVSGGPNAIAYFVCKRYAVLSCIE